MDHKTFTWQNEKGLIVYGQSWTPDSSPKDAVIIIHGLGEHSGRYEPWAKRFVAQKIAVYALDLHGHGRTSGGRGHTEAFGYIYDDVQYLLSKAQSEFPKAKLHLYGHSMEIGRAHV